MLLKGFLAIFTRKFVPKIDRKLPEKQVKKVKRTSLKLFPSTPKLQINQPVKRSTHSASPGIDYKHISLSIGLANQRINRTAWSGFGRLGCLLGYVGRVLGLLGGLLAPLEASRRPLGTLLARLGASWWPLGCHLVLFGDSWRPLGSS